MKYDNRNRRQNYIFTVTNSWFSNGENLFNQLKSINRSLKGGFTLQRYGRLRDRKSCGVSRERGHVTLDKADRWDLYLRGPWMNDLDHHYTVHTKNLLRAAASKIRTFISSIEYVNVHYKNEFEQILYPTIERYISPTETAQPKFQISPEGMKKTESILDKVKYKTMKKTPTTKWKVNLTATVTVHGDTQYAMEQTVKGLPFLEDVVITNYEQLESHQDLPLVRFDYPDSERSYGVKTRDVRVVRMNDEYIEGFEGSVFKKFRVDRVSGSVSLLELPTKS